MEVNRSFNLNYLIFLAVRLINCTICSMTNKTLEKKDKTTLDALMEIQKKYIEEIKEQAKGINIF